MKILLPEGWQRPRGYSNGILAEGRLVFVAGMVGWDGQGNFVSDTFAGQFEQVLRNTLAVLAEGGAAPDHIVRMSWYITDRAEYLNSLKQIGTIYRELIGSHYPAMAVVEVSALMEERAKLEIETTAVIPQMD